MEKIYSCLYYIMVTLRFELDNAVTDIVNGIKNIDDQISVWFAWEQDTMCAESKCWNAV